MRDDKFLRKISLLCCFLFISGLIKPLSVFADYPDMDMSATPNPVGSGARAMGMGGAFISVADDATAASWNPAGLLQLTKPEISQAFSHFSSNIDYQTSGMKGDCEDDSSPINYLNYFSAVVPFSLFRRNFVFSINFQHLYEFSQNNYYTYRIKNSDEKAMIDTLHKDHKYQKGSLHTLSPALAFQISPSFFIGLTGNIWNNNIMDNGWENRTIQDTVGFDQVGEKIGHSEIYEKFDFSGFNMHLGFLFKSGYLSFLRGKRRFRFGGVLKTPFDADIQHERQDIFSEKYHEDPFWDFHKETSISQKLTLKMPLSYGLGFSFDFSDSFSAALDVYHTYWDQYLMVYPSGKERSPINKELKEEADIKPTTQLRLGVEYLIQNPKRIIPIRMGVFYDPEPAGNRPDDFYGVSFGTGISYRELFSLDFVYQFRFGEKSEAAFMDKEHIAGYVSQHYFYTSVICYLF